MTFAMVGIPVCTMSSFDLARVDYFFLFCSDHGDHMESGQRVAEISLLTNVSGLHGQFPCDRHHHALGLNAVHFAIFITPTSYSISADHIS